MKKMLTMIGFLLMLIGCGSSENYVEKDENFDDGLQIIYSFKRDDLINPYKATHKIIFSKKTLGMYPFDKIKVIDLNGDSVLSFSGGYVALYGDQVDIRLYSKSDNSGALLEYPGNGVYRRK